MVQDASNAGDSAEHRPPDTRPGRRSRVLRLSSTSRLGRRRGAKRRAGPAAPWERVIVRSMAVVTMTGALFTYVAVQQDENAVALDELAVFQSAQVQQSTVPAHIQAHAEGGAAARYRRLLAEAEVIERRAVQLHAAGAYADAARLADDARLLRATADNLAFLTFDPRELEGATAADQFDTEGRLQVIVGYGQFGGVPDDQPATTARDADARHLQSRLTVAVVTGLLGVLVLLTVARLVKARWRPWLLGFCAAAYLTATALGSLNAVRDVTG